jgi:purine-binding chemotaxis protein CheW
MVTRSATIGRNMITYLRLVHTPMQFHHLRGLPEAQAVLAARARALAHLDEADVVEDDSAVLTFVLGGAGYALPAAEVREVQPLGDYTRLPAVPPFVLGLVNVRGRLVAALDLRPLLTIPTAPLAPAALLLIVGSEDASIGLIADEVTAVRLVAGDLLATPSSAAGQGTSWVRGVDKELNLHLDPAALLADPRLTVNQEPEAQDLQHVA